MEGNTTRVPYLTDREDVPEDGRESYDGIAESRGGVRGPFAVLLNSPELAGRVGHLGAYVRFESGLADPVRELAILTTAREFDCAYEWAAHEPIARDAGVREAAIETVADRAPTEDLSDEESLVARYGRNLFGEHAVPDPLFEDTKAAFGVEGVVELTATMGYYSMIACVLNAFEVTPEEEGRPELP
ncbi:MAG: carboxymuconolactone decarboxylase family protein [Haloarculaceae archaeon]